MPEVVYIQNRGSITDFPEFPGSPLPLGSRFYVEHPLLQNRAHAEISQPGSLIRISAPKKMGKSSLLLRLVHYAETLDYTVGTIDFQQADAACFSTLDKFLRWFCLNITRQLNLTPHLNDYWDEEIGSKVSCTIYFENYLLGQFDTPLVLLLNEVNRVFEYPAIAQDFLSLLRFWYEQARRTSVWQKLRFIIAHSTESYVSLKLEQSPFNVGLPLKLPEFTPEQVQDLAERYALNWDAESETAALMQMVGGHPYLVHLAIYHLSQQPSLTLGNLLNNATAVTGIYSNHLRSCWKTIQEQPELLVALQQLLATKEGVYLEPLLAYELNSLGLVRLEGRTCQLSCELYQLYFQEKHLSQSGSSSPVIERLERENQRLQTLANTDALTQIPNRRSFDSCLHKEWRRMARQSAPLALILCDIDYFKRYNDIYGHLAGDECLRRVAQSLIQVVERPADFVARYGGEEFALILPHTNATGAMQVAEAIRSRIKEDTKTLRSSSVTLSLGVASVVPNAQMSFYDLIAAADIALYESKQQGRDRATLSSTLNFRI